jgi:late competence protein required for DNA uptake (superfamily II DNA/RNA helicase)
MPRFHPLPLQVPHPYWVELQARRRKRESVSAYVVRLIKEEIAKPLKPEPATQEEAA